MTTQTEVLDREELDLLLAQPKQHTAAGCRNYAMLVLMAQTGVRCNECLQIMPDDIKLEMWKENGDKYPVNVLRLKKHTTKGKKARTGIPLTPDTLHALRNWMDMRDGLGITEGPLFCTIHESSHTVAKVVTRKMMGVKDPDQHIVGRTGFIFGTQGETVTAEAGTRLSGRYVREMVRRYAAQAGIEKRVHPHLLRHQALTDLYDRTQDLRLVQEVAGHSSPNTTQRYAHVHPAKIARAFGVR